MSTVQVVDENKEFNSKTQSFLTQPELEGTGLAYHTVAVFGSQSSGKSTLLNHVFKTKFDVMDNNARRQTTHGIWLGCDLRGKEPLLVLDVEGTDGRERGDDQDFERKAALFALATSEILVVNMWENQVGLYFGANMALLRTVFEVNLSLFHASPTTLESNSESSSESNAGSNSGSGRIPRSRILFVIRDFTAQTPLEQLAITLREDLDKQWKTLAKPAGLENSTVSDFFDIDFQALPHKVWQSENFVTECDNLATKITDSFKPEYHRDVPLDGWSVYANNIWQKIEQNKDLDLPTHHELVAKFRCTEISAEAFNAFSQKTEKFANLEQSIPDFGKELSLLRSECLQSYDNIAGKYQKSVYLEIRKDLEKQLDDVLLGWYNQHIDILKEESIALFKNDLKDKEKEDPKQSSFGERSAAAVQKSLAYFDKHTAASAIDGTHFNADGKRKELVSQLSDISAQLRQQELQKLLKQVQRYFTKQFNSIESIIQNSLDSKTDVFPWMAVKSHALTALEKAQQLYGSDLGVGGDDADLAQAQLALESEMWLALTNKIQHLSSVDVVLQRMRDVFENVFKYTDEGLPVVWGLNDDIDAQAVKARAAALETLPVYASAVINSDGEYLSVPVAVAEFITEKGDEVKEFDVLLSADDVLEIKKRFQRLADANFVEAKRSVMQTNSHIPMYIIVLLCVLGYNEFMMVIRNPFMIAFLLVLGAAWYVVYSLGMTATVLNLMRSYTTHAFETTKSVARDYLNDDSTRSRPSNRSQKPESVDSKEDSE